MADTLPPQIQPVALSDGNPDDPIMGTEPNPVFVQLTTEPTIDIGKVDQGAPGLVTAPWFVELSDGTNQVGTPSNPLTVQVSSSTSLAGLTILHSEVTSVASSIETTVLTYTVPALATARVQKVEVSGSNGALFRVKVGGVVQVDKRTWWANFNETFNFESFDNGLELTAGQVLTVTVFHVRPYVGDFEASVYYK